MSRLDWCQRNRLLWLRRRVLDATDFLPENARWPQRIWHIEHHIYEIQRCESTFCSGQPCKWRKGQCRSGKYQRFCSRQCCIATSRQIRMRKLGKLPPQEGG